MTLTLEYGIKVWDKIIAQVGESGNIKYKVPENAQEW